MTTFSTTSASTTDWIDFYALLEIAPDADEELIRRRLGQVYGTAAANSDHRDAQRRVYYRALVEQVLPQCRRVLLDSQSRARYDHQHTLQQNNDPTAQDYATFFAALRNSESEAAASDVETVLPARAAERVAEEKAAAQAAVQTARDGAELDLLPSQVVSVLPATTQNANTHEAKPQNAATQQTEAKPEAQSQMKSEAKAAIYGSEFAPDSEATAPTEVRAKVLTAAEAARQRRRELAQPAPFAVRVASDDALLSVPRASTKRRRPPHASRRSRVIVEAPARQRAISPTSLHLLVASCAVMLFTITQA